MNDLLKDLPHDKRDMMASYATIQVENEAIMLLSTQYALAALYHDEQKKQKCAALMVERARALLEAAEKLASLE
jgi:hypothetical protein